METKYVGYFRVSTKDQGESGLGLQSQRQSVNKMFGECIAEFTEVESGRKKNRPELLKAIEMCKQKGATLVVAKLDRLSRDPLFVFTLRDSGVKFIAADNVHANDLTIGLLAVIAGNEATLIRTRTKAALAVKKQQLALEGKRLGCPNLTSTGRTIQEVIAENRKCRVYSKPDSEKVRTLKILKDAGQPMDEVQRVATQLFGKTISKVTIYSYLKSYQAV